MDQGLCRSGRTRRSPRAELGRYFGDGQSQSTGTGGRGNTAPFGYQEAIGRNTESSVMMKTAPAPSFIMTQSKFLLKFFIIPLDDPALLCHTGQVLELGLCRQG